MNLLFSISVYLAIVAIVTETLPLKSPLFFRQEREQLGPHANFTREEPLTRTTATSSSLNLSPQVKPFNFFTFLKLNASRLEASEWETQYLAAQTSDPSNYSKTWLSEADILGRYGKVNAEYMVQRGFLEPRQNPNFPDRIQYSKTWWGEQAFRELYDAKEVANLFAHDLVKTRIVDGNRTQYFVEGTPPERLRAPWWSLLKVHGTVAAATQLAREAPLSEGGYRRVAALRDDQAMQEYARRWLQALNLHETSEDALGAFVPWFSGTLATQSLSQMLEELQKKDWVIPVETPLQNAKNHSNYNGKLRGTDREKSAQNTKTSEA